MFRDEFEDYLVTINKAGKRLTRTIEMIVEYSELLPGFDAVNGNL
jgi:hypothetical protein